MDPSEVLIQVAQEVSVCQKCVLHHSRNKSVPGEGPANAEFMFIGEGPGFNENEQGRPFVGQAGKFLEELLAAAGLKRADVFIGNVVKCRPPGNRDPLPEELDSCRGYLDRQIAAIRPQIIVTLGRYSMARFLPNARISAVHGKAAWVGEQLVVAMYHPAAALHQPALRNTVVADFASLPAIIAKARKSQPAKPIPPPAVVEKPADDKPDEPVQLSLF